MFAETSQIQAASRELWLKISKGGLESQFLYKVPQVILQQPAQLRTAVQCLGNTSLFQLEQTIVSFFFFFLCFSYGKCLFNKSEYDSPGWQFLFHKTQTTP